MIPNCQAEWKTIAKGFEERWNFPHCCGAIDGKHIVLQCPANSGSEYFNYKSTHSIVLMALCDYNYGITYANIGVQGRMSDGGVFQNCELARRLENGELNLPPAEELSGRNSKLPYVIVGDNAFPLKENIMVPYPGIHEQGSSRRIYNYRLSRARRVIENVFGIMSSTFRVFRKPISLNPEKAALITKTCIYLHNFLRRSSSSRVLYTPPGTFDTEINGNYTEGSWRRDQEAASFLPLNRIARKCTLSAAKIREEFEVYFNTNGQVPWQNNI